MHERSCEGYALPSTSSITRAGHTSAHAPQFVHFSFSMLIIISLRTFLFDIQPEPALQKTEAGNRKIRFASGVFHGFIPEYYYNLIFQAVFLPLTLSGGTQAEWPRGKTARYTAIKHGLGIITWKNAREQCLILNTD
jgi:hypothetical protein